MFDIPTWRGISIHEPHRFKEEERNGRFAGQWKTRPAIAGLVIFCSLQGGNPFPPEMNVDVGKVLPTYGHLPHSAQMRDQMMQIGPLGFADEYPGALRVELCKLLRRPLHLLGFMQMMVGHAQRVPGMPVHGLQACRFFQRPGRLGMMAQMRMRHAHAIPGPVLIGRQLYSILKCIDGFRPAVRLVANESKVEPGIAAAGVGFTGPDKPGLRLGMIAGLLV